MSDVTYIDAIHAALDEAMERDPDVFLYGQDIGKFGGAFKATKGLQEKYPGRVLDAPISEDAMAGVAIGAAIEGVRPVLEMQFADFSSVALNQIINQAATHYYRTGVPVPLTMRLPSGGTPGSGPFHSQSMEAIYSHYPGLVVVTPATVADAHSMLLDSIAMNDPVIYCEHKFLYRWLKSKDLSGDRLPIGKARITRPGKHATVVTYSAMVHEAARARDGDGPQLVVASMLRLTGHGEHDDGSYVDAALKSSGLGRDSIEVGIKQLIEGGFATVEEIEQWQQEAAVQVQQAVAIAQKEDGPDPYKDDWMAYSNPEMQMQR